MSQTQLGAHLAEAVLTSPADEEHSKVLSNAVELEAINYHPQYTAQVPTSESTFKHDMAVGPDLTLESLRGLVCPALRFREHPRQIFLGNILAAPRQADRPL